MRVKLPLMGIISGVLLLLSVTLGCGSAQSSSGVARIDQPDVTEDSVSSASQSNSVAGVAVQSTTEVVTQDEGTAPEELTDEEITTEFTECLRAHGFNIPDPVLNADGTVDSQSLRQSIMEDPKFNPQSAASREVFRDCVPLLQGATFAEAPSREDTIQLQDDLLKFAECLREKGIDVPDPDFSTGTRASMRSLLESINLTNARIREDIESCRELIFGTGNAFRRGR